MDHLNLYLSDKKFPISIKTKFREYFMCCQVLYMYELWPGSELVKLDTCNTHSPAWLGSAVAITPTHSTHTHAHARAHDPPSVTQDHFRSKYNRETLKALSGKYRAEAAQQEFGSSVLRFCVDQYVQYLRCASSCKV